MLEYALYKAEKNEYTGEYVISIVSDGHISETREYHINFMFNSLLNSDNCTHVWPRTKDGIAGLVNGEIMYFIYSRKFAQKKKSCLNFEIVKEKIKNFFNE